MKATGGMQVSTEVERKFDVGPGFVLPSLGGLPGVSVVSEPREFDLDATYLDTADLRLLRHRMTLRRRTGGEDAGWHLKRPRGDGERDELSHPLGRSGRTVPAELRAAAEVQLRGAELGPVVRLQTRRLVTLLTGEGGAVLAEVADDAVTATLPAGDGRSADVRRWRELEVELVGGDLELLAAVGQRLLDAGAWPSESRSKLGRALADRVAAVGAGAPGSAGGAGAGGAGASAAGGSAADASAAAGAQSAAQRGVPNPARPGKRRERAGTVVLGQLSDLVAQLMTQDPRARADAPDGVHQMRVATRRLRSCLSTFRPLFDRTVTDPLRDELAWLAGELGGARDAEVIRDHLLEDLDRQPADVVRGPVRDRVVATMRQRHAAAHDELLTALDGARYFALLDALDALTARPPLTETARGRADDVLLPLVARTWQRTDRLVRAVDNATDAAQRDLFLHDVRKSAKRARYAAEALTGRYGAPARRFAGRMKAVQEILGDHQDSVVIRHEILALAAAAEAAGEPTFTYGRLHAREEQRGMLSQAQFARCWLRAARPSVRAWLH
jgi:CHAD domain-containing protein